MPAISLLSKTYTYTNGNPNDADEVELDLSNAYANFGTIQTDYNQLVTGAYTIAGVKTFSSPITLSANSNTVAGSLGYSSNVLSYYNGTKRVTLPQVITPKNYLTGPSPLYASAATITLPTGLAALDSTHGTLMEVASDQTVSLATSGANGLDTGSEASNTWYYVYLIGSSTDSATYPTKGLFSVTNEAASGSVTLPSGYDIKRQLPTAIYNDSSGDIRRWVNGPDGWVIWYDLPASDVATSSLGTTATAYTVSAPPGFNCIVQANITVGVASGFRIVYIRHPDTLDASVSFPNQTQRNSDSTVSAITTTTVFTDTSGQIEVRSDGASTVFNFAATAYKIDSRGI